MKKRIFVLLTLLSVIFAAGIVRAADLVVYAALDEKTPREIIKAFKERMGLDAELALQIEQAGTVASRIKTEAKNPTGRCFYWREFKHPCQPGSGRIPRAISLNDDKRRRDRSEVHGSQGLLDRLVSRGNVHPLQYKKI